MKNNSFEIINRPENTRLFDKNIKWSTELIDYENHPAYSNLISKASFADKASSVAKFSLKLVPLLVKRLIKYEMIPLEIRNPKGLSAWVTLVGVSLRNALGLAKKVKSAEAVTDVFKTLEETGCCVIKMDDELYAKLEEISKKHFDILAEARVATENDKRDFMDSRGSVDSRTHGVELYNLIQEILKSSGVLPAVSRYMKRQATLIDVNPQINDASDNFWKHIFEDMNFDKIPATSYYHRDATGGDLKAIFYMSDVGPKNGPFSYVVGSNNLDISRTDDLIGEANDHNGLTSTDLKAREQFSALPKKLRQKGAFGNDLVEDTPLFKEIMDGNWSITGSKGSIVLFDTKGIHRGGMVVEGDRKVITTVLG